MLVGWSELIDQLMAVFNSSLGDYGPMGIQVLKIIWINILLSGDNAVVIALACRALPRRQRLWGIILGLLVSIPLIVAGATLIMAVLHRFPILVWAGAALLGWIAGQLLVEDPVILPYFQQFADMYIYGPLGRHATSYSIAEHFAQA